MELVIALVAAFGSGYALAYWVVLDGDDDGGGTSDPWFEQPYSPW